MEGFVASGANPSTIGEMHASRESWEAAAASEHPLQTGSEGQMLGSILPRFAGSMEATLSHLVTVHNETCGCQTGSGTQEAINRVWNQKKVLFMELQKQCGLNDFEDFMNRVLRLVLNNPVTETAPLSESDFWMTLRTTSCYPENSNKLSCNSDSMEEDLADINNLIAKDIGGEPNQVFMNEGQGYLSTHTMPAVSPGTAATETTPSPTMSITSSSPVASLSSPSFTADSTMLYNMDELLRMKRKEKHMAPIDCSGVSVAFNVTWKCKICDRQHRCKDDCDFYRPYHRPRHVIPNNPANVSQLPNELELRSDGVYTGKQGLRPYSRLGPLKGEARKESDMDFDEDRSNIWLVHTENGERKCIMTDSSTRSNWLKEVAAADSAVNANVLAISIGDELYLVCGADGVNPHTKLKYFAKEDPTTEFWTSWTQAWANQKRCSRCSIHGQFATVADYRVHISLWHDVSFQGNPQNRIYYCPDCSSKRIGAKEIVQHCREVHDSLPFLCRHCSKRFESYNSLIKHKNRIHAAEKPLKKACERCGKVYLDPKALRQHVKQVHERSRQLHCVQCEFIFSSKYALNRHVREVHQKQQEYVCVHCSKQFTQQSNLKQHMLIHLGAKPFHCQQEGCKAAFTTKQCLQVHYRKVHHFNDETMPRIQRINLDDFFSLSSAASASATASDDSSTHSGEFFPMPTLALPTATSTFNHLKDVS